MVEYHVDTSEAFQIRANNLQFGGQLSVRRPVDKPIVIFIGQDEAIFKQFLFLSKMWTGPNGERPLLPKDEGAGCMISAFICREHGLIREINDQTLALVNANRQGATYQDEEAALEINGTIYKTPLVKEKSPFLVNFEYGENKEGYWNYNHMVLQFEDAIDVLKVLHPEFHFVFLFDHSSGHSKQRPDGLNVSHMNKSFGGKCPAMRESKIECADGFLGPFQKTLEPGQTQSFIFKETDEGPVWMTPQKREACRHDVALDEFSELPRNKAEIELDLKSKGVNTKGKNKKELVALCAQHEVPIVHREQKKREGWEGKPKGLQQVLWERGLIDGKKLKKYTLDGKTANGILDWSTSLRHIMGCCTDFLNEEGMMQHVGRNLGVTVLLTPKCHAEIAGEGIEYLWACSKGFYRSLPLKEKKGKDKFKASVIRCLSAEVLGTTRIRKFARRARRYLLAYHALDSGALDAERTAECCKYGPVAIDKLIHSFKTHRCAMDFDYKFIMNVE